MGNVTYHVDRIEGDLVHVIETFDLTNPTGPGILMRGGQIVDCEREHIQSAFRRLTMRCEQARELGLIRVD